MEKKLADIEDKYYRQFAMESAMAKDKLSKLSNDVYAWFKLKDDGGILYGCKCCYCI